MIFTFHISCEDVIDIDLNDAEPRIVIEAKLYDKFIPATVILSYSTEFFGAPEFNTVSDAEVYIIDNLGDSVLIPESEKKGFYTKDFFGDTGKIYTLRVKVDDKIYTAQSEMIPPMKFDSVVAVFEEPIFHFDTAGYIVNCYITNKAQQEDFARISVLGNSLQSKELYLINDFYTDGNQIEFRLYREKYNAGDTVITQLYTMDENVYRYLYTFAEIAGETFHDTSTPYNPETNINNGALGYFGAFSTDFNLLIIPPQK